MDRWRKPANVTFVGEDPDTVWIRPDGLRRNVRMVIKDRETWERLWNGYLCYGCAGEPLETPMPESCPLCGFNVRRDQRRVLEIEHVDSEWWSAGPSTSLQEELDRVDDTAERMRWERDPTTGIVVRRKVS